MKHIKHGLCTIENYFDIYRPYMNATNLFYRIGVKITGMPRELLITAMFYCYTKGVLDGYR